MDLWPYRILYGLKIDLMKKHAKAMHRLSNRLKIKLFLAKHKTKIRPITLFLTQLPTADASFQTICQLSVDGMKSHVHYRTKPSANCLKTVWFNSVGVVFINVNQSFTYFTGHWHHCQHLRQWLIYSRASGGDFLGGGARQALPSPWPLPKTLPPSDVPLVFTSP